MVWRRKASAIKPKEHVCNLPKRDYYVENLKLQEPDGAVNDIWECDRCHKWYIVSETVFGKKYWEHAPLRKFWNGIFHPKKWQIV